MEAPAQDEAVALDNTPGEKELLCGCGVNMVAVRGFVLKSSDVGRKPRSYRGILNVRVLLLDAPVGVAETEQKPETSERELPRSDEIRMWKERSARMEALLAKKNAKIQEMEETVLPVRRTI